jgi:diguanylate cyclase (GGDEF)-like protein
MPKVLPILMLLSLSFEGARCTAQSPRTPPHTLTQVSQVVELTNGDAARSVPVRLDGTVTFVLPQDGSLFIEKDGAGVYVNFSRDIGLQQGDQVLVTGVTDASFRPELKARDVRLLSRGSAPVPQQAKFEDLIRSALDSRYVQIDGHVLSAAMDLEQPVQGLRIKLQVPQGLVEGSIAHPGKLRPEDLLDADVRVSGVAGGDFDSKMQMAGVWLDVNSSANVEFLHKAAADPWSMPISPMENVIFKYRNSNDSQRVRVAGTLTYYEPGAMAVVEHQGKAMLVETRSTLPLHAGVGIEATGFPEISGGDLRLASGQLRQKAQDTAVQPKRIHWENASSGQFAYNLVAMEGVIVAEVHDSRVDLYILQSEGHLFSASLRHSSSDAFTGNLPLAKIEVGSRVRLTGICFVEAGNHWRDQLWFDLRMRSLNDIALLKSPSWWTTKRLAYLISLLSVLILGAGCWVWLLGQRVRRQTAVIARKSQEESARERKLARQEQQRSHVLEMISSSEPLPGVLREITSMVSSRLDGASCWFELKGNQTITSDLERPDEPTIVFQELFSPEGKSLGFLLATPLPYTSAETDVAGAMLVGARLAEVAIDTRRLYSDLRHRSEHDLLTEIPNRFSMEKQLDQLLQGISRNGDIFGLIYVDLDKFKQVNDRYGHRTGDLYLQEVTRRMKFQLRNGDMLARIGGDEFIALVPTLRSRADAEEIAERLERCFDDPFMIDGYRLDGSASVGLAVYPEDGTSKEELQRSADAAMYANKESKKHREKLASASDRVIQQNYFL